MTRCVLIVEDTEDSLAVARDLLTFAGFRVIEARDGAAAIELAKLGSPDLILMDMQLPLVDGYEATRRIKNIDNLADVPIIAVTSYALPGDEERALRAGCYAYVKKPYSVRELLALVKRTLGSERP